MAAKTLLSEGFCVFESRHPFVARQGEYDKMHVMTKKVYGVAGVIIVLLGLGTVLYVQKGKTKEEGTKSAEATVEVTGATSGIVIEAVPDGEMVKEVPKIPAPSLKQSIGVDKMSVITKQRWEKTIETLKKDPTDFQAWVELGLIRSNIGDLYGAKLAWEYASALVPKNSVAYGNLGYLYAYDLKDNKKAEENYLKAIENNPAMLYLYFQTYEFYRDIVKDPVKARRFVENAVKNYPTSAELKELLKEVSQ